MNRNLTDIELSMVCEMIATRMGLHFPRERWAILSRSLASAAVEFGFQNMNGFIQWLLSSELNKDQILILASHLTISETYFWREPQVFTALTDSILPQLIRSKGKEKGERSIRIWSVGCSTGEEPYSIAIALQKAIPKIEDWNITILATDINPGSINKAINGTYGAWSFRNSPAWLKSNYFLHKENGQYEIIPEIKKMVTFTCLSLAEMSAISNINTMDIIFCRNVLMYFTNDWINKISQNLFDSLSEDGWFVVSSSELSSQVFPQFTPVNFPGAVLYRKGKNGYAHSFDVHSEEMPQPLKPFNTSTPSTPSTHSTHFQPQPQPLQPSSTPFNPLQQPQAIPEETSADKIFAIRLLADQGHLEEALTACNGAIASYKLSSTLYFLRASILQELDKSSEAIVSLKQAIYIDPEYIVGHFALGNLFIRQGNTRNAERYFKNVLDLLSRCSNDDILPESEGLSAEYLREIIITNMDTIRTK
jgi:chemotaxis protein methyltransferase CheR